MIKLHLGFSDCQCLKKQTQRILKAFMQGACFAKSNVKDDPQESSTAEARAPGRQPGLASNLVSAGWHRH